MLPHTASSHATSHSLIPVPPHMASFPCYLTRPHSHATSHGLISMLPHMASFLCCLARPHSHATSHGLIPVLPRTASFPCCLAWPHSHATSWNEADFTLVTSICSVHTSCFLFQTEDIEYMCTSCRGKLARLSHQLARLPR